MILNSHLPIKAWLNPQTARLPSVQPVTPKDWLTRCDAYEEHATLAKLKPELLRA